MVVNTTMYSGLQYSTIESGLFLAPFVEKLTFNKGG